MKRSVTLLLVLCALFGLAGCGPGGSGSIFGDQAGGKTEFAFAPDARQALPAFGGPSLDDPDQTLLASQYQDKLVFINFWGSWCGPCRDESPALESAWTSLTGQGLPVQFLGVNVKDSQSAGQSFVADQKLTFPIIFDPTERTLLALRGYPAGSIPSSLLVDKKGRVAYIWLRQVTGKEVSAAITALNQES